MEQGYITSIDGTTIFYQTQGSGFPIVFCYGVTCGPWHFHYQWEYFKSKYKVIMLDYRGHNRSGMPSNYSELTIRKCAEDVRAVLNHLGCEKAICVGHSMGVAVLVELSSIIPEKLSGLVLICGKVDNPFESMFRSKFSQVGFEVLKWGYLNTPRIFNLIYRRVLPSKLGHSLISTLGFNKALSQADDIQTYIEGVSRHPPETLLYLLQNYAKYDGKPLLGKIKCPTLIIGGENDLITPIEHQDFLAKAIPNAEYVKIPYASHCTQLDMPEFVNLKLEQWLERINLS
ncbi:MAG: hypothetical protein A3F16_01215 [Deltaproteobacteria bacterium RIFCSPHIGHO2_12_FULL_43_9]|nr:MAG: hypothetical protein A3F16_01215 [Deltaproteobacteria bacterium RIFCSPHIGHO2_12_FULL_43_9]